VCTYSFLREAEGNQRVSNDFRQVTAFTYNSECCCLFSHGQETLTAESSSTGRVSLLASLQGHQQPVAFLTFGVDTKGHGMTLESVSGSLQLFLTIRHMSVVSWEEVTRQYLKGEGL
jgi:hypothetical protein